MAGALDGALGHTREVRNALVGEVLQAVGAMLRVLAKNVVESCCAQGPGTSASNVNLRQKHRRETEKRNNKKVVEKTEKREHVLYRPDSPAACHIVS